MSESFSRYYNMEGEKITREQAYELWSGDQEMRRVAVDFLPDPDGGKDIMVSTVLLVLDHSFTTDGPPLIFETMVFGGEHNEYQERYATREQAEAGHAVAVKLVKGSL